MGDTVNVSGQSNCTPVKVPECRLSEDLGSLFDRSAFSDVMLCVSGREFLAHKAVLAGMRISLKEEFTNSSICRSQVYFELTHVAFIGDCKDKICPVVIIQIFIELHLSRCSICTTNVFNVFGEKAKRSSFLVNL